MEPKQRVINRRTGAEGYIDSSWQSDNLDFAEPTIETCYRIRNCKTHRFEYVWAHEFHRRWRKVDANGLDIE